MLLLLLITCSEIIPGRPEVDPSSWETPGPILVRSDIESDETNLFPELLVLSRVLPGAALCAASVLASVVPARSPGCVARLVRA